jgi:DUF1680 family protein
MPEATHDGPLIDNSRSPHAALRSLPLGAVRWTDGFWADRFEQLRDVTLPRLWELAADPEWGHALTNLRIAAGLERGEFAGTHWQDAWIYKWIEAASVVCRVTGDDGLDRRMDDVIEVIVAAQQPDGYIATQITVRGWARFTNKQHHELYVMGHLLTAACVHHRMTGKTGLLDVACRAADYVYETFRGRDPALAHLPINPSIIMGAVELYRTVGERRYLDMANLFIDLRGAFPGGSDLNQDRIPLRDETQVVGHAVFYTYLFAGAADAYMETGDESLLVALERLWDDLTSRRLYITGGCCPIHRGFSIRNGNVWAADDVHEAAGASYDLPNSTGYNEICGQVGSFMWNARMLVITGEAKYADLMERQLYNSIISGIGLDGASWFYTNPLRWYGADHEPLNQDRMPRDLPGRPPQRNQICCPTNLLRLTAELHGYSYSASDGGLWCHMYAANRLEAALPDGDRIVLSQETDYPWDGRVTLRIEEATAGELAVHLRIPGWADGARLSVNGEAVDVPCAPCSYARLARQWQAGDTIALDLPMAPRLLVAHPKLEQARGQVAVMRGPIVYCLESPDLPDGVRVWDVRIPRDIELTVRFDADLLGGVVVLEGHALVAEEPPADGPLYRELDAGALHPQDIRLIPYHAWANRGNPEMSVWLPLV